MFRPYKRLTGNDGHFTMAFPVAASQTIVEGDAVTVASGLVAKAASDSTKILGVAANAITTGETVTSADLVEVFLPKDLIFEVDYTGSSKTSLTDADLFGLFDLDSTAAKINLDASTVDQWMVVGYNNTTKKAKVVNNIPLL